MTVIPSKGGWIMARPASRPIMAGRAFRLSAPAPGARFGVNGPLRPAGERE